VTIRRTSRRQTINVVCLTFMCLLGCWGLNVSLEPGGLILYLIAGTFGLASLISTLYGPTCVTDLQTAIQTVELPSLSRIRKAQKALALLRERIIQAQGEWTAPSLEAAPAPAAPAVLPDADLAQPVSVLPALPALKPCDGKTHRILFWLLIVDGALNGLQITFRELPLMFISMAVSITAFGFMIVSLVRQHQTDLRPAVRRLTWGVAAYLALGVFLGQIIGGMMSVTSREAGHMNTQLDLMRQFAKLNPLETPWLLSEIVFETLGSLGLGLSGLLLLRANVAPAPTPDAPPPPDSDVPPPPPPFICCCFIWFSAARLAACRCSSSRRRRSSSSSALCPPASRLLTGLLPTYRSRLASPACWRIGSSLKNRPVAAS